MKMQIADFGAGGVNLSVEFRARLDTCSVDKTGNILLIVQAINRNLINLNILMTLTVIATVSNFSVIHIGVSLVPASSRSG